MGTVNEIALRAAKKHEQKSTLLMRVSEDGWCQRLLFRTSMGAGVDQADLGTLNASRSLRQKLKAILALRKLFDIMHIVGRECRAEQRARAAIKMVVDIRQEISPAELLGQLTYVVAQQNCPKHAALSESDQKWRDEAVKRGGGGWDSYLVGL